MTHSISATYKKLTGAEKPLFTITLWAVAVPLMIVGIKSVPDNWPEILFFLAGTGICLVGASPAYWTNKMELTAHLIGSYAGIGFGMTACLIYCFSITTLTLISFYGLFILSQFFVKKIQLKNYTYWMEVLALVIICTVLFFN
jgi:hypothetical protein